MSPALVRSAFKTGLLAGERGTTDPWEHAQDRATWAGSTHYGDCSAGPQPTPRWGVSLRCAVDALHGASGSVGAANANLELEEVFYLRPSRQLTATARARRIRLHRGATAGRPGPVPGAAAELTRPAGRTASPRRTNARGSSPSTTASNFVVSFNPAAWWLHFLDLARQSSICPAWKFAQALRPDLGPHLRNLGAGILPPGTRKPPAQTRLAPDLGWLSKQCRGFKWFTLSGEGHPLGGSVFDICPGESL